MGLLLLVALHGRPLLPGGSGKKSQEVLLQNVSECLKECMLGGVCLGGVHGRGISIARGIVVGGAVGHGWFNCNC